MVESIIADLNNIAPENYLQSFPLLKVLSKQALQLIPDDPKYRYERIALEEVVSVMDKTMEVRGENFNTWLTHVFRIKKDHALEALRDYLKKEKQLVG